VKSIEEDENLVVTQEPLEEDELLKEEYIEE